MVGSLIKKPWVFIRVPLYESYYFGVLGPGFLLIRFPHYTIQVHEPKTDFKNPQGDKMKKKNKPA